MDDEVCKWLNKGLFLMSLFSILDVLTTYYALVYGSSLLFEGNMLVRNRIDHMGLIPALFFTFVCNVFIVLFYYYASRLSSSAGYLIFMIVWGFVFRGLFVPLSNMLQALGLIFKSSTIYLYSNLMLILGVFFGFYLLYVKSSRFRGTLKEFFGSITGSVVKKEDADHEHDNT